VSGPVIVHALTSARARASLRRAVPRGRARLQACRSLAQLERTVAHCLTDAIVVDARSPGGREALARCAARWPRVPRFAYSAFRPDDAELVAGMVREATQPVVEGVEDSVMGDLMLPRTASALRAAELVEAPRMLRLTDELQRRVWQEVLRAVGSLTRAGDIAKALSVSREHLSRQFGAGGAPNLKRVMDLARTATAADLLGNPGYRVRAVARILGFASASHLSGAARRVAGVSARELPALGPRGVLGEFANGRTRSRTR
jgi:AraC-like DNA-binding protein